MSIKLMKQWLKAMESVNIELVCDGAHHAKKDRHKLGEDCPVADRYQQAITSLRQAIAEAEKQELVKPQNCGTSFCSCIECVMETSTPKHEPCPFVVSTKEGTHHCALSHREPLTDEQISAIDWKQNETLHDFARAIEAAHGIKWEA